MKAQVPLIIFAKVAFVPLSLIACAIAAPAQTATRIVDARTSIFGAGNAGVSSDGTGLVAIAFSLNGGAGRVLSFSSVTGITDASGNNGFGPDGGNFGNIPVNVSSFGGIS